jgi:SAM-dependent methyltransferase
MTASPPMPHASLEPSPWVRRHAALLRPRSRVLDLAAGSGRHARMLAGLGHDVVAVDRDADALAALAGVAGVETRALDLETGAWPLAGERFDAIVVANYLHRPTFDATLGLLADDGVLIYETFAAGNEAFGRPSNPAFLLAPGELLERVRGRLDVVAYEEGVVAREAGKVLIQRLAAVGQRHPRPWALG